jgi:hypothetical protein
MMAESAEQLGKRLFGFFQEGQEQKIDGYRDLIRKGGNAGIVMFLRMAKAAYGRGDPKVELLKFTKEHFGLLPKADQEALIASGLVAMLKSFVDDELSGDWGKAIREG